MRITEPNYKLANLINKISLKRAGWALERIKKKKEDKRNNIL